MSIFEPFQLKIPTSSGIVTVSAWSTGGFKLDTDLLDAANSKKVSSGFKALFSKKILSNWMPNYIWIVEHPQGLFLIDTGFNARINSSKYKKLVYGVLGAAFSGIFGDISIAREQEVDFALQHFGYQKTDLQAILLTHLHFDHIGGLYHFPETPVLVHGLEWEQPDAFKIALFEPQGRNPRKVALGSYQVPYFGNGYDLTQQADFIMVHTPGHTKGHVSYLIRGINQHYLIAGDLAYYENQITRDKVTVIAEYFDLARKTYHAVLDYQAHAHLKILCSHDPDLYEKYKNNNPV